MRNRKNTRTKNLQALNTSTEGNEDSYLLQNLADEKHVSLEIQSSKSGLNNIYLFFIHWIANDLFFINTLSRRFPALQKISDCSDGVSFVIHKLWAPVFLGVLLHDLIRFAAFPSDRYDVTLPQILIGAADNQYSFSSHLGSDLPQVWSYSLGAGLAGAAVLTGGVVHVIRGRNKVRMPLSPKRSSHQEEDVLNLDETDSDDSEDDAKAEQPVLCSSPFFQYREWASLKSVPWYWHPPFWLAVLFSHYAALRLGEIWISKIQGLIRYIQAKKACGADRIFLFMPEYGNNECTVCGEWDFVEPRDRFDAEKCFNGLLNTNQSHAFILKNMQRLLRQSNFTTVDFSSQSWSQWTESDWEEFLSNLLGYPHDWQMFNLSSFLFNPGVISLKHVKSLAAFIKKTNITMLDVRNQRMGDSPISYLSDIIAQLKYLDVSSNQLTNVGFLLNATGELDTLKIGNNQIGDKEAIKLFNTLAENSITHLDADHTGIHEEALKALSDILPYSQLKKMDVSKNDFSQADLSEFGRAVEQSPLKEVHLTETRLIDEQVAGFISVSAKTLDRVNLSKNKLSDHTAKTAAFSSVNGTLTALDLSGNDITDQGVKGMAIILKTQPNNIAELNLADTQISPDGFSSVVDIPRLTSLDVTRNPIGDEAAKIINQKQLTVSIKKLSMSSTQLTDEGGKELAEAMRNSTISHLDISNNQVTSRFFEMMVKHNASSLKELNAADNKITDQGVQTLAVALPKMNLQVIRLEGNPLTEAGGVMIAKSLIKPPTPHLNKIGDKDFSVDEARALRSPRTVPALKIRSLYFNHNVFQNSARRALQRILPSTPDIHIYALTRQDNAFFSLRRAPLLGDGNMPAVQMNASHLALSLVTGVGTILIGLIAVYLIYRAVIKVFSMEDKSHAFKK